MEPDEDVGGAQDLLDLDEGGMRGAIVRMMAGGREKIDTTQLTITERYDMITLFDEHDNRI